MDPLVKKMKTWPASEQELSAWLEQAKVHPSLSKHSSPRPKGKDAIVVKDLRKDYPLGVFSSLGFGRSFRAVDSLTFGIPTGQCFGLLGINGAGDCIA